MVYFTKQDLDLGGNFIMLCGAPGSGKMEYATKFNRQYDDEWTIISFDKVKETYQETTTNFTISKVFERVYSLIKNSLENQQNVIYVANNCNSRDRKNIMKIVNTTDSEGISICLVSQATLLTCLKRNNAQGDNIPEEVVERLYIQLKHTVPALYEGYDLVGRFE